MSKVLLDIGCYEDLSRQWLPGGRHVSKSARGKHFSSPPLSAQHLGPADACFLFDKAGSLEKNLDRTVCTATGSSDWEDAGHLTHAISLLLFFST